MPDVPQNAVITLQTLYWKPGGSGVPGGGAGAGEGPPGAPGADWLGPGVWPVFFKIDGTSAEVTDEGKLVGTATTYGTQGKGETALLLPDQSVVIPPEIGQWSTQIVPIPLPSRLGTNVGGLAGVAVLAIDVTVLPDAAIEAGHNELNSAVQEALNEVIADLPPYQQQISPQEIAKRSQEVYQKVYNAIKHSLKPWQKVQNPVRWSASTLIYHSQDDLSPASLDQLDLEKETPAALIGTIGFTGAFSQSRRSVGQGLLGHFPSGVVAVAGFTDPAYQQALVATGDGNVREIWWQGSASPGQGVLSHFASPVAALAGFYTPDGYDHAIVATGNEVTELWWQGSAPAGRGTLYTFSKRVVALAGYYSADGYANVIVATADNAIAQLWWQGSGEVGQGHLAQMTSPVAGLAGYFGSDGVHHVIVATADGYIAQLTWQGSAAASPPSVLAQVSPAAWSHPIGVGAYDAPADGEQHVIVGMSDGMMREFHGPAAAPGHSYHDDVFGLNRATSVGAFADAAGTQHVIVGTAENNVHELWWASGQVIP